MNKSKGIIAAVVIIVIIGLGVYGFSSKTSAPEVANKHHAIVVTPKTKTTNQSSSLAVNNSIVETRLSSKYGNYLANKQGYTLYTYTADSLNHSNCNGSCLSIWPAYTDTGSTTNLPANFGVIVRNNGQHQFTYKGMPLYTYTGDNKPGVVNGNNVGGFVVARP